VPPSDPLLDLAVRAARAGGVELTDRFGAPATGISRKSSPTDLVSDADRASESAIVGMLRAERPDDAVIAEEGAASGGNSGVRWLVDPLDGTTNYLWGIPQWCVSVAAHDRAGARVGVVHDPLRDETFTALRGAGAWHGERRLEVRRPPAIAEALVGTGFNYAREERARQAARLRALLPAVRDLRRLGAAALDLAWVAAGRLDAYFETGLAPWDWAAGDLLVREAGGVVHEIDSHDGGPSLILAGPGDLATTIAGLLKDDV